MTVETGQNVKTIFRNALHHYNTVLKELKKDQESDVGLAIVQEDIQKNIDENTSLITQIDSPNGLIIVENNRKFLCGCLRGYLSYLEITKSSINTKLEGNFSLPTIKLTILDEELRMGKEILKSSCEDQGV